VITNFTAESAGTTPDMVVDRLLETISDRHEGDEVAPQVARALAG
jgi:hypothetical protein